MLSDRTLKLFRKAASQLPAYQKFLAKHNIDSMAVTKTADLAQVPPTSKKNYLTVNKMTDLVWEPSGGAPLLFCATSGSTGEPYYFPRDDSLADQYSYLLERYLKYSSYGPGRTLVIIGFGMGVWIGGVITMRAFEIAGKRSGVPLAILPTGNNKPEIYKALRKLAPQFDQVVLVGYPPLIKEILDEAPNEDIDLSKLKLRLLFAAEAFSETFRKYVCQKAGIKNPMLDTLNVYGTADIGAMAYETPLSILIRRLALEKPELYLGMFHQLEKTPTLAQYNPEFIEFEEVDNEILLSADGALPLIRYAVGDHGGVLSFEAIRDSMKTYGINLDAAIQKAGLQSVVDRKQPFVYVYERIDLSTTIYGMNIYPEFIREALIDEEIATNFTERFTMATKTDAHHNQFLQVNVELQKNAVASKKLENLAIHAIQTSLLQRSSEFADMAKTRTIKDLIQVVLWPNGHTRYFSPGTKQKWVEK